MEGGFKWDTKRKTHPFWGGGPEKDIPKWCQTETKNNKLDLRYLLQQAYHGHQMTTGKLCSFNSNVICGYERLTQTDNFFDISSTDEVSLGHPAAAISKGLSREKRKLNLTAHQVQPTGSCVAFGCARIGSWVDPRPNQASQPPRADLDVFVESFGATWSIEPRTQASLPCWCSGNDLAGVGNEPEVGIPFKNKTPNRMDVFFGGGHSIRLIPCLLNQQVLRAAICRRLWLPASSLPCGVPGRSGGESGGNPLQIKPKTAPSEKGRTNPESHILACPWPRERKIQGGWNQ